MIEPEGQVSLKMPSFRKSGCSQYTQNLPISWIFQLLLGHNFWRPWFLFIKIFLDHIFFDWNFFGPTNLFCTQNLKKFGPKFFLKQKFCEPKTCSVTIVCSQTFLDRHFFGLNFFLTQMFLDLAFLDQNFVWTKCFSYRPSF